ncbi:choline transporter-like protein 2 [Parambassis ranga]|uniref:Choline transporter-like protein 2 n=1 Tax=Parambassis ranga TaxID=210632 RepID=A0A6P7J4G6_9TELE|nr:choline transporter-like protein 2 [Parambassis ranga]
MKVCLGPSKVSLAACSQPASQHSRESLQQEHTDQEDGGETKDKHNFMDFPVRDVAEQLTRLDAELFFRVVPFHCLGCIWSQRDKKENRNLAPTVRATICQFNAVTNRVITSLLCPSSPSPSTSSPLSSPCSSSTFLYPSTAPSSPRCPHTGPAHRARIIERWIAIAQECRELKNFSSLKAILSALQANAVYRLKKTWSAVSRESMATFELLCETFPDENCVLTSREILVEDESQSDSSATADSKSPRLCSESRQTSVSSGVVPYLGTYLTVLTMLDTALTDTVEGGLINFEKRRREFEILSQIRQLQASCSHYKLPVSPHITAWLQAHTLLTDQERKSNVVVEARQVAMRIFEDYTQSWHWILLGLVIAMVVSLLFIVLLRYLAGVMVWVMIMLVILVIGYGIFHCYMEFASLKGEPGANVTIRDLGLQTDFSVYLQIRQTWLAFMIILAVVEAIIILLLIFLRKRILIAIALIKEASRAVGYVMSSLFYPLLTFTLLAVVIAYWAITAVFLSTSNEQVYKVFNTSACPFSRDTCNPKTFNTSNASTQCPDAECLFAFYGGETVYHKYLILLQFYNVFLFFWCANFVTALGQVTLSGAFASYYWAFKKPDDIPAFPIFASLGRALRYHTGSLAFGSLILSLVQVIRVLLEYLDHKLKGAQNKFAQFLLKCFKCCFWCLEKCIKFLNRNAYIMIAIYGKSFCTSARDAFFLLMRNIVRVAVLDKVTDFLLFLGKLLIVGIVGIFSFFFFSGRIKAVEEAAPSLNYYWVPILTVVVGSYLIAHGFFSVYAMCVDTLFLCFCEDLERNDGSSERPYFMSPELHEILSKAQRLEEDGVEQADAAKSADEVKLEEEAPLQQQDGEIQLKQQALLTQDNEEQQPLQADEPTEEKTEDGKVSQVEEIEKKEEPEGKDEPAAEKQETEEKPEETPAAAEEAEGEETGEKKEDQQESQEEAPPSKPEE